MCDAKGTMYMGTQDYIILSFVQFEGGGGQNPSLCRSLSGGHVQFEVLSLNPMKMSAILIFAASEDDMSKRLI